MKYEKFHFQISSRIVQKNDLFLDLNVHCLSKKQQKTFLSNLCKIPDIFANEIFHISNMINFSYFEMEKILPLSFSYDRKNLLMSLLSFSGFSKGPKGEKPFSNAKVDTEAPNTYVE